MAKTAKNTVAPILQGSQLFKNPVDNQAGIPQGVKDDIDAAAKGYSAAYNKGSFGTNHPFLTAGLGALLMGPSGLMLPMVAQKKDQARKSAAIDAYSNYVKGALENQKNVDTIAQPRNEAMYNQSLFDEAKRQGLMQQTVPDLYQRDMPGIDGTPAKQHDVPAYSREFMDSMRKGLFSGSDSNYSNALNNYNRQLNYAMPGNTLGNPETGTTGMEGQSLQASANYQGEAIQPPPAPFFLSDPQTIMQQATSAGNNAFTEGQKRYEFDQEKPKLMAEVQKLVAEGKATEALALLRGAQTKTEMKRPALIQAQTGDASASASLKNRTDPNLRGGGGRAPNMLELMNPEQRQNYLNMQAGMTGKPLSLNDAYQQAGLEQQAGETDWSENPTAKARIAQKALQTLGRTGSGFNPQFQSPASGKPSKGGGVTLSTGKKVNL